MLAALDAAEADEPVKDLAAVQLGAWFHDAVYNPRRPDNEEASALLAETMLTELVVPAGRVAEVVRLVRLTASHDPAPDDVDGALLCDVDLAILAAAPSAYRRYADAVRREYSHVPEADFCLGRAQILRALLARPTIYRRGSLRDKWEKRARINLAMEVSALTPTRSDRKPLLS
jgi:predicted metal-dependent HD superfamily phosphohydrolase